MAVWAFLSCSEPAGALLPWWASSSAIFLDISLDESMQELRRMRNVEVEYSKGTCGEVLDPSGHCRRSSPLSTLASRSWSR